MVKMKTIINGLLIFVIIFTLFSCDEKRDIDVNIKAIDIYFTDYLDVDKKPVCLKFNISSVDKYDNTYLLEEVVSIHDNDILIKIDNIKKIGSCEYPQHLSTPEPANYKCPASTDYFALDNLNRGLYNIKVIILNNTYNGRLNIQDHQASLMFNDNNVSMYDSVIHIIPDSCIFGTYYSKNSDSVGFQDMINRLKKENCKQINIEPGNYRKFEVDNLGRLILNSGQTTQGHTFILKFDLDIDKILNTLNDFVTNSNDANGIIFNDHFGNYYNIKK